MERAHNFIDITGQRFNRLVVLGISHKVGKKLYWLCQCNCGATLSVLGHSLKRGNTKSCGCLADEYLHSNKKGKPGHKHGMSHSKIYSIHHSMLQQCNNRNNSNYKYYGGRGIILCEEWKCFEAFFKWATSNGYQEGQSFLIRRVNNDGNYCPENCICISKEDLKDQKKGRKKSSRTRVRVVRSNLACSMYNKSINLKYNKFNKYYYFYDPEHPLSGEASGMIYYHRHVASLKIGRWLYPEEVVHHIDGSRLNNNPDNIEVLPSNSEHAKKHKLHILPKFQICYLCGQTYTPSTRRSKFCCYTCAQKSSERFSISKEELQKLIWEIPTAEIAKRFSVSDNAIAKRCKKFSIAKPPRGYWNKVYAGKKNMCTD